MKRLVFFSVPFLLLVGQPASAASSREVALRWSELAPLVRDQKVTIVTSSGALGEGKVLQVETDTLVVDIRKATDGQAYPKGRFSFSRPSISTIQVKTVRGNWRVLGAAIGAAGGAVAGWALAEGVWYVSGEGGGLWKEPEGAALLLGLSGGVAAIGYLAGRSADTEITSIRIVPESRP